MIPLDFRFSKNLTGCGSAEAPQFRKPPIFTENSLIFLLECGRSIKTPKITKVEINEIPVRD